MNCHWVGEDGHDMDYLALDQLKESEAEDEVTFHPDGHVTKDKEAAVRVVNVLETVEGGDDSSGQGTVCWSYDITLGFTCVHQIAAHEQIRALEVVPGRKRTQMLVSDVMN